MVLSGGQSRPIRVTVAFAAAKVTIHSKRHLQSGLDCGDNDGSPEFPDILISEEKPLRKGFIVLNVFRYDDHDEVRVPCDTIEICDVRVVFGLPLEGFRLFDAVPLKIHRDNCRNPKAEGLLVEQCDLPFDGTGLAHGAKSALNRSGGSARSFREFLDRDP